MTSPSIQKRECRIAMSGARNVHVHLRRAARARRGTGRWRRAGAAIRSRKPCAARGPGAVDGDELRVVDERFGHGLGVVRVPRRVEAVFEFADGGFVGGGHGLFLWSCHRPAQADDPVIAVLGSYFNTSNTGCSAFAEHDTVAAHRQPSAGATCLRIASMTWAL